MTCCVAVAGVLCTDSRETGLTKSERPKHFRPPGCNYVVGVAGDVGTWQTAAYVLAWPKRPTERALVRLMHAAQDGSKLDFNEVSLLVVTRTHVFTCEGRAVTRADRGAIGSGAAFALGYLRAYPDDLEGAVAAACYHDPYCAGPVQKIEL